MPPVSKKNFEEKLASLDPLRTAPAADAIPALIKALADKNNFCVARAAAIAADRDSGALELEAPLLAAYARFFENGVKSDTQCAAKIATAKALKAIGHRDPATYLIGLNYTQPEPGFGPPVDTAADLRSTCALAMIDCPMTAVAILRHLAPLLADPEPRVRTETVRALAHLGDPSATPLLRLKVRTGDASPEVLGQCFTALLELEPPSEAVPFVAAGLDHRDTDVQLEAACALAQAPEPAALEAVIAYWHRLLVPRATREAILLNLGASPLAESAAFLRRIAQTDREFAATARRALQSGRFHA